MYFETAQKLTQLPMKDAIHWIVSTKLSETLIYSRKVAIDYEFTNCWAGMKATWQCPDFNHLSVHRKNRLNKLLSVRNFEIDKKLVLFNSN